MREVKLGRGHGVDVQVADGKVSRAHASFIIRDGKLEVTDLGSANGTFVNGRRLNVLTPVPVPPGAEVKLGPGYVVNLNDIYNMAMNAGSSARQAPQQAPQQQAPQQQAPHHQPQQAPQPVPGPVVVPVIVPVQDQHTNQTGKPGYSPMMVEIESQKSYLGKAWLAFFLYWLIGLPGLIANVVFLMEAKKTKEITKRSPEGYGCLWVMMILLFLPLITALVVVLLGTAGLFSLSGIPLLGLLG